ncbi:DUF4129 domain-containing protein [Nocardia bovistercoris]|uniref:DUF4129 domain-containing protein n=1 Tax=Nocardia bovistercoris TaxID=2785916 RepID=UPI002FCD0455
MIVLITLLGCAVIALRGYLPGTETRGEARVPSAVAVALMPVLFSVSVTILLAGVIASQHRLPLAMPDAEAEDRPSGWRLGRGGLAILGALASLAMLAAVLSVIHVIGARTTGSPPAPPTAAEGAPPTTGQPPAPSDPGASDGLTGTALLVTTVAAIALLVTAATGLALVVFMTRRKPAAPPETAPAATPEVVDSLARAAEMGLAAMNAPGQDPRTAIIACYVAMERGLAFDRSAAPLISDTPMEVLARAFARGALHDASARELVALFEEARFSPHSMLGWQRMRAEQLLRIVLADLQGQRHVAVPEGVG